MNVDHIVSRLRIGKCWLQTFFIFASLTTTANYLDHDENGIANKDDLRSVVSQPLNALTGGKTSHDPINGTSIKLAKSLGAIFRGTKQPVGTTNPRPFPSPSPAQRQLANAPYSWTPAQSKNLAALHWKAGKQVQAKPRHQNGTIQYLEGWRLEEEAQQALPGITRQETTAYNLLEKNQDLFLIDQSEQEWELLHSKEDSLGFTQVQFSQTYDELEVWPSSVTVQINPQGHAHVVTAAYAPTPKNLETKPSLLATSAYRVAVEHLQSEGLPFSDSAHLESQQLLVYAPLSSNPHLAYSVSLHEGSGVDWQVMVDAHSGEILTSINQVCTAAAQGSGADVSGQTVPIELWFEDNQYSLLNTTKSMHDEQRSDPPGFQTTVGGILIYEAGNVSPQENPDNFNPGLVSSVSPDSGFPADAVSASINLAKVYDYYEARHQRTSIDGQGGNIIGITNVPINNAYWQNDVITFGNLDTWTHALDFAGHEMTHGVIEKTAGLIYQNQPGALNEAIADIFGESVEAFENNGVPDWKLGTLLNSPLRDMRNPGSLEIGQGRPYPSRMSDFIPPNDPFLDNLQGRDNGGVHLNSSIINHAFYQLAEGLPESVGLPAAEQIFYRAVTTKLQKQSQFLDCRIACIQSAEELFGVGSTEARQTAEAFNTVEIFDQTLPTEPTPIPSVTGEDSTLFTFVSPIDGLTYLARREAAQQDDSTGILLVETPIAPGKRPVVSRDGTVALFVTANFSVAVIDTLTGEGEVVGDPGSVWSVGLSPDGRFLGIVLAANGEPEDKIRVLDLETDEVEEFELKAPALDGGATDTILFADALNFTPEGRFIYYDALNRISFSDGSSIDSWSIYALDRQTSNTIAVVPPIPGLSIGNPSLGRSHFDHLVFEAQDSSTGQSHIFTQDLASGKQAEAGIIFATVGLAFPAFFGNDNAVLYTDYAFDSFGFFAGSALTRQPLGLDGMTPDGPPSIWLLGSASGPTIGTIYRRGTYEGISELEIVTTPASIIESNPEPAMFLIRRSGAVSQPLGIQFVITGTATPNKDYVPISLSVTFEPDQIEAAVPIQIINDSIQEQEETLTVTLSEARNYSLGTAFTASVQIQDDDTDTLKGYSLWAAENGIEGIDQDLDQDGRVNLLEYALGTNPSEPDQATFFKADLITIESQQYFTLTLDRSIRRDDVNYGIETSTNLTAWANADAQMIVVEDSDTKLIIRQSNPASSEARVFMRLTLGLR
ncbi:M4 family metallopeptidase [Verrucomicrobia bacterium]|nr:M4 family metallopeptidase [Verrucomicrobiota bacterium]